MGRKLFVVKSNELIQTFHGKRTLWEQKCISYICANIVAQYNASLSSKDQEFSFSISEFMRACDICKSGQNRKNITDALDALQVKSRWVRIQREDGSEYETTVAWIVKARIEKGICYFYADEDMLPSILNLHGSFTKYECENILKMNKPSSIALYELLKSYSFEKRHEFDAKWLLMHLGYDDTPAYVINYANFMNKVMNPCLEEINELTDLDVSASTHKTGREVTSISFEIKNRDKYLARLKKEGLPIK